MDGGENGSVSQAHQSEMNCFVDELLIHFPARKTAKTILPLRFLYRARRLSQYSLRAAEFRPWSDLHLRDSLFARYQCCPENRVFPNQIEAPGRPVFRHMHAFKCHIRLQSTSLPGLRKSLLYNIYR